MTLGGQLRGGEPEPAHIDLYLDGVHVTAEGTVRAVPAGTTAEYLPGTRVLTSAVEHPTEGEAASAVAAEQQAWLTAGRIPGEGTVYGELVTGALLDLHVLTNSGGADGAAVAAWSPRWRYVWPRDGAFIAVALATAGHIDDARTILRFLTSVQAPDGSFEARYLPDGSGVPDSRGEQADGSGWVLWAAAAVLDHIADGAERTAAAAELRPLVDRATSRILELTATPSRLPRPSADYWEVAERHLTLGTVAPLATGLEAAAGLYADLGEADRAATVSRRAAEVRAAMVEEFADGGYERYASGGPLSSLYQAEGRDTATAFLLPPFTSTPVTGAEGAWLASIDEMRRPAGGLAPGAGWKEDGISWTPTTSLYALAAAENGHADVARELLDWIADHRTSSGAIPEKVLADGSPAAVAPLGWSAANVVLAVAALEEAGEL